MLFQMPRKAESFTLCPALSFRFLSKLSCLCLSSGFCACGRVSLFCWPPAPPVHHKTTRVHRSLRQVSRQHTPNTQSAVHMIGHTSTPDRDRTGKEKKKKKKKRKCWQEYCFYLRQEAEFQILRLSFCKPKLSILIRWALFQSQR